MLALFEEESLQFRVGFKVGTNGFLALADDDEDFPDASFDGFFHHILNGGLVDDGDQFLGNRLGGRQKASAKTRCGYDRPGDHRWVSSW